MKNKLLLAVFGIAWSCSAFAASDTGDYKCNVNQAGHIAEDGVVKSVKDWAFFVGKEFVVERKTGAIVGKQFKNNIASIEPQVYDHEVNGYAVVAPSHNQVVSFLQINNFEKTSKKPFIYIMTNVVLTGTCEQY